MYPSQTQKNSYWCNVFFNLKKEKEKETLMIKLSKIHQIWHMRSQLLTKLVNNIDESLILIISIALLYEFLLMIYALSNVRTTIEPRCVVLTIIRKRLI